MSKTMAVGALLVLVSGLLISGCQSKPAPGPSNVGRGAGAGGTGAAKPAGGSPAPAMGQSAPDFTLESLDGRQVSLSDFKGKAVFLDFWASWCGPCQNSMPHTQKLHEESSDKDLVVLGVNSGEDKDTAERFMKEHGYDFTVVLDKDGKVGNAYNVTGIPKFVLIDKDGDIYKEFTGWAPTQGDKIAQALKELGIG